jgi:hypothetical protein
LKKNHKLDLKDKIDHKLDLKDKIESNKNFDKRRIKEKKN